VPPRITLAWSRCEICGRHAPVWQCRIGSRRVNACLHCIVTLRLRCAGLALASVGEAPREGRRAATAGLEPDEALIERLTARGGRRGARRRRSSGS
jgi:hypothetical protein